MKTLLPDRILYELRRIKKFFILLADFSFNDSWNLTFHKNEVSETNFIFFKPIKWSHPVKIRNDYRDLRTLRDVFIRKYHIPPIEVEITANSVIVDLGCNTGLTIAHFKNFYPNVKIIGYEMDLDNYLLAKINTQTYDNVLIYNKAIWIENSLVEYHKNDNLDGYSIHIKSNEIQNIKVESTTIKNLIKNHRLDKIDYLKMDIEGVEKDILSHYDLSWLDFVKSINIEFHSVNENDIKNYIDILEGKGFRAWKDTNHVSAIIAVKNDSTNM